MITVRFWTAQGFGFYALQMLCLGLALTMSSGSHASVLMKDGLWVAAAFPDLGGMAPECGARFIIAFGERI